MPETMNPTSGLPPREMPAPETTALRPRKPGPIAVLIADLVGLKFGADGQPDPGEVKAHIEARGGTFHVGARPGDGVLEGEGLHFFYQPDLSVPDEIAEQTGDGRYDALIAAATFIPAEARFNEGGVRIGAGTGNMGAQSWGGGNGVGGVAPLMNTPGFNARATAQMAMKALLRFLPDLPLDTLHARSVARQFDTGRHLRDVPTQKLEGKRMAVIGYGNIGREMARLAQSFQMDVVIHARAHHRDWIVSEGFAYAETIEAAVRGADVLSPHTGLGPRDPQTGTFANAGLIDGAILALLKPGAIVVNFDRGEVVDADALRDALSSGQVRAAAIDADLFVATADGALSGPLVPYLDLPEQFGDRVLLLPHAAADTDHPSRVAGAKQAVDQIFAAVCERIVINGVGETPAGYIDAGAKTPVGVGRIDPAVLRAALGDADLLAALSADVRILADIIAAAEASGGPEVASRLATEHGDQFVLAANRLRSLLHKSGLHGPV